MTTKQLTGTITLPGVDPDEFEITGEVRSPNNEWFYSIAGCVAKGSYQSCPRIILRKKPRKIRVTPTQADLDAATEPIPCWVKAWNQWNESELLAIDKFSSEGRPFFCRRVGWSHECEIEKEVTE